MSLEWDPNVTIHYKSLQLLEINKSVQILHSIVSMKTQFNASRGFSLFEAILVIGLVAILAAVSLPRLTRLAIDLKVETSAKQLATNLRFARMSAVKQKVEYQVVIHNELATSPAIPKTYDVQYKSAGSFVTFPRADTKIDNGLKILSTSTLSSVIFDPRGSANAAGNIRLRGENNAEYRIDVKTTGSVNVVKVAPGV